MQNVLKAHQVTASVFGHAGHGQMHIRPFLDLTNPADVARILEALWGLGLQSGVLIANPPPAECALPHDEVAAWVEQALAEAARERVSGKDVTPYLLQRLAELSEGRSLEANVGLIVGNAGVATKIASA